jgi:hypothetical protein
LATAISTRGDSRVFPFRATDIATTGSIGFGDALAFLPALTYGLSGTNCFVGGTQVVVGDGGNGPVDGGSGFITKNIEDIKVGDLVLSRDQSDPQGKEELKPVTQVFSHTVTELEDVTIAYGDGKVQTIQSTTSHPYYVQGLGWTAASGLVAGELLLEPDGSTAVVRATSVEYRPEGVTVYNFEVEGDHTYFVGALGDGDYVWVHNGCGESWSSARSSFWKSEAVGEHLSQAQGNVAKYSATNLLRMSEGKAPQMLAEFTRKGKKVTEAVSMELHHSIGQRFQMWFRNLKFNLMKVTPWEHAAIDPYRHTGGKLIRIIKGVDAF